MRINQFVLVVLVIIKCSIAVFQLNAQSNTTISNVVEFKLERELNPQYSKTTLNLNQNECSNIQDIIEQTYCGIAIKTIRSKNISSSY